MMKFVFAALAFTAIIWGTTAVALRQSHQEQVTMEENGPEYGWSITETGAVPGWSVTPAHPACGNRRRGADSAGHRLGELEAAI